jgi:hypothetical protein
MTNTLTDNDTFAVSTLKDKLKSNLKEVLGDIKFSSYFNPEQLVIAGGCFTSLFHSDTVKDYDFFILNSTHEQDKLFEKTILKHGDMSYIKNKNIKATHTNTSNAVQWILTSYKNRKELIDSFDMLHCTISYVPHEDALYVSPLTLHCIKNKIMRPNLKRKPEEIEYWRIEKFRVRGWKNEIVGV